MVGRLPRPLGLGLATLLGVLGTISAPCGEGIRVWVGERSNRVSGVLGASVLFLFVPTGFALWIIDFWCLSNSAGDLSA